MTPKSPPPFKYSSFKAISGSPVHLRLVGEDASVKPTYSDAELRSEPIPNGPHQELSARFYVPGQNIEVTVSEVQYAAWNRYK
jgi:hypothetical protein